ncbi:hypothetical protein [Hymenobacter psychrophilus]|uniref:DUF3037 domain-containing protein n=1 Tax=Hymenobacter psychrophilus TaxID=651662 RepID=A0A1H3ESR5_9BACT|nr:hypothetical protein [Hymenobacter psychrophilus]SDX81014.1 hypothetical protein SAMN04488069_103260 [Hymenobacter psychrophilus]
MKIAPFHTLIRIAPNPASGEAVVIGIVFFDGTRYWLRVSSRKVRLAGLLAPNLKGVIRDAVANVERRVALDTQTRQSAVAASTRPSGGNLLQPADWEYLSRYSNGIVRVGPLNTVAIFEGESPEGVFEQLYVQLVDGSNVQEQLSKVTPSPLVQETVLQLMERVKPIVHTNLKITDRQLPELFFEFRMECIGLNGSFTAAHALPLESYGMDTLQQHVFEYDTVARSLLRKFKRDPRKSAFYLLCDEPNEESDPDKHKFWRAVKENPLLTVIPSDKAEMVAERIEETGARKFLKAETQQAA